MVQNFQTTLNKLLTETFPEKDIFISPDDQPHFNEQLRKLKRKRLREYSRHGKTEKYFRLLNMFEEKMEIELSKYLAKIELEVTEGRRGSTYPALKRLGLRPGETTNNCFQLPNHVAQNLSPAQSAEIIATHFSNISQEYEPLNIQKLPPNVQHHLFTQDKHMVPILSTNDVLKRIIKGKKPNSQVPGDLPNKLVKEFSSQLAIPATAIFNKISQSASFPSK